MTEPSTMLDCDGLILAGGKGQRAGGNDKGLLSWRGRPLAEHIHSTFTKTCERVLISCNRNTAQYQRMTPFVFSDAWGEFAGPLAGIYSAQPYMSKKWLLVSPCDTPLLMPEYALRMFAGRRDNLINIAWDGERLQYLHCLLPASSFEDILRYLQSEGRSVKRWLDSRPLQQIDFSDCPEMFSNINTLDELAHLDKPTEK
ncbi:molybdenum cofactor guanylyltransferase MobA [Hahella aquimaris]|uniref:molybdenum cofactor guanylyltransferase MobA n=1 Tax=Hahella sp. HNIBRBA332 TaxID=3015983 RepID=UPI00273AE5FF|nr:molybdenum cofactor guanylyltransferase MobA [Hahella sp. HNIBRBA332]WLQ14670.1 molybdenum cofactor guanylyltransferase MobA [Hahella sp. HNIBRBA332]